MRGIPGLALCALALALTACSDGDSDLELGGAGRGGGAGGAGGGAGDKLTVVVMVVDSLMPQEIGAPLTPTLTLAEFRGNATAYGESRAVFSAETIPNHVAMMTGVYPARNGIPTNNYWNRSGTPEERDLSLPTEVEVDNLFTTIKRQCPALKTAAVLSKDYLYEVFSACGFSGQDCGRNTEPDFHFDPTASPLFIPSPAGLTPDLVTMQAALGAMPDADFIFINLGEVDRVGHIDETGILVPLLRNTVLLTTDTLIRIFIESLKQAGRWERTVMFVISDHGMDWSTLPSFVDLDAALAGTGGLFVSYNGGTASVYLADQAERGTAAGYARLKAARDAIAALPGVDNAWYTRPNPQDAGHELPAELDSGHENFGDLVATAVVGYRMAAAASDNNLIPGNHGHLPTLHNTFMVGGGAAFVRHQLIAPQGPPLPPLTRAAEQSENVDVAPTVAWLLGLPTAGYEGRVLREAFDLSAPPSHCGALN